MASSRSVSNHGSSSSSGLDVPEEVLPAVRQLSQLLVGKLGNTRSGLEELERDHLSLVANLSVDLLSGDFKRTQVAAKIISGRTVGSLGNILKGIKRGADAIGQLGDKPCFDEKSVDTFNKLPPSWVWGVLQGKTKTPIPDAVVTAVVQKSSKVLFNIMWVLCGVHPQHPLSGDLLVKVYLAQVIVQLIDSRGDLLNLNGGFFKREIPVLVKNPFAPGFGVWSLRAVEGAGEADSVNLWHRVGNISVMLTSEDMGCLGVLTVQTPIHDNFNMCSAFIRVLGRNIHIYTIGKLAEAIPTRAQRAESLTKSVGDSMARIKLQKAAGAVQVSESLGQ
ncbi:unnamed protein product, partial [Prorocentrum cordatum]